MGIVTATLDRLETHLNYAAGAGFSRKLVPIHDGRAVRHQITLDQNGFVLRRHETAVSDFFDPTEVRLIYYREVEQLLKEATGAPKAVAFEHDVRSASAAERDATGARQAVKAVHDDYTEKSAPERVRLYLPQEAEALKFARWFSSRAVPRHPYDAPLLFDADEGRLALPRQAAFYTGVVAGLKIADLECQNDGMDPAPFPKKGLNIGQHIAHTPAALAALQQAGIRAFPT
jgi:hypothetical protein